MSWAAANAPKVHRETLDLNESRNEKRRSTETVEAALSRLSKAYTSSMECIGALHKTDRMLQKEPSTTSHEALATMERVATAARSTLEKAILLDPLVVPHIPTLYGTMRKLHDCHEDRWKEVEELRPIPPVLSSVAHKTTIRELAYLALVNYSDLLQSCCPDRFTQRNTEFLLDRGVVEKLPSLKEHSCWKDEAQEDTLRLAVTALCDASHLDGSDPTLWLKLACASRRLETLLELSTVEHSKHRRLQRYALERGSSVLPPHLPPNRAIQRALNELMAEPEPTVYESHPISNEPIKIVLDLPRYSWSMLGRMLLRAAREGADYHVDHKHRPNNKQIQFGSPMIELNLSPMLVLPTPVLGRVCLFLDNGSIWRFEATCRALSVAIMSARAAMEETTIHSKIAEIPIPSPGKAVKDKKEVQGVEKKTEARKAPSNDNAAKENHRSSQRLRSQQITSGKKAERLGKRQSFDYCFIAATTGTTIEEFKGIIQDTNGDDSVRHLLPGFDSMRSSANRRYYGGADPSSKRREAQDPIGESSLAAFVETWSKKNSGPMDLMMQYLKHVAMNAEDVFASDPGGTVVLTSCILSCKYFILGFIIHVRPF